MNIGILGSGDVAKALGVGFLEHRHIVELYFTPPGGEEILADRSVYTRIRQ